jgi:hypothetical protein
MIYIYIKTLTPFFTALQDRVCHKFKKEKHNEEDFRLEPPWKLPPCQEEIQASGLSFGAP